MEEKEHKVIIIENHFVLIYPLSLLLKFDDNPTEQFIFNALESCIKKRYNWAAPSCIRFKGKYYINVDVG